VREFSHLIDVFARHDDGIYEYSQDGGIMLYGDLQSHRCLWVHHLHHDEIDGWRQGLWIDPDHVWRLWPSDGIPTFESDS